MRLGIDPNEPWGVSVATNLAVSRKEANSAISLGPRLLASAPVQDDASVNAKTTSGSILGIVGVTVVAAILGSSLYLIMRYLL